MLADPLRRAASTRWGDLKLKFPSQDALLRTNVIQDSAQDSANVIDPLFEGGNAGHSVG